MPQDLPQLLGDAQGIREGGLRPAPALAEDSPMLSTSAGESDSPMMSATRAMRARSEGLGFGMAGLDFPRASTSSSAARTGRGSWRPFSAF